MQDESQQEFRFIDGAIPRPRDDRDILLGAVQAPVAIPASYLPDVSWLVPNYQGQTPTCGAHASSHLKAVLDHLQNPSLSPRYTPRFSWIRIKAIDGFPLSVGTDMRSIFKSQENDGMADYDPLENDVALPLATYSELSAITPAMTANAAPRKIGSYAFGSSNLDFESLCQHIYQNGAVLLLIKCDDGYFGTANPTFTTRKYTHFVAAYGYDADSIRIVDSADRAFPFKTILKKYITPTFIIESGTAVDIPPEVKQQLTQSEPAPIPQNIAPTPQNVSILQMIANAYQAILNLLKPKP